MSDPGLEMHETFNPSTCEIEFLTEKINVESRAKNISGDAYPFGIFLKYKTSSTNKDSTRSSSSLPNIQPVGLSGESVRSIVGGCNGSIVYGSIYTDQLWIHPQYRGRGLGKTLMEKVHELGKRKECTFSCVSTMDFQEAQKFYESLGYIVEFERRGYANDGKMIYLKKDL